MRAIKEWKPDSPASVDELAQQHLADAAPARGARDVDRVLDGGGVRRAVAKGRDQREAQDPFAARAQFADVVVLVHRDDAGMRVEVTADPGLLFFQGARDEIEADRGLDDLGVVDVHDRRGVVPLPPGAFS